MFDFNDLRGGGGKGNIQNHMRDALTDHLNVKNGVTVKGAKADWKLDSKGSNFGEVYIINSASTLEMAFTMPIYEVSFDYIVFSDTDCKRSKKCSVPAFTFKADGETILSFDRQSANVEDQRVASGIYEFLEGVTRLEFLGKTEHFGIDNLMINTENSHDVPEADTNLLLGTGLAGLWVFIRRKKKEQ